MNKARRYNKDKLRYDLLPSFAISKLVEVYTKGADKYTLRDDEGNVIEDGSNNWLNGLPWTSMIASAHRHIEAWKQGEDIDPELGTFHLANAAWNILGIIEFYRLHPELDDRIKNKIKPKRISLDVDDVLADFVPAWCKLHNTPIPTAWSFDRTIMNKFDEMQYAGKLNDFYLNLQVKTKPEEIPFEPAAYITARPCPSEITEAWLDMHGFPVAPVITVGPERSKVQAMIDHNIDIHVDDNYNNYLEINQNGKCCFLFDALHNKRYNVGYRRIHSLKELL